jgi:hypothetical protein
MLRQYRLAILSSPTYAIRSLPFVTNSTKWSYVEVPLLSQLCMNNSFSNSLRPQPRVIRKQVSTSECDSSSWTVNLECSVPADTRRIFNALTVPEYIEAWISVPGYHPECCNVTIRNAHGFNIEHRCINGATTMISGTYCSFLKRKLSFSWQPSCGSSSGESFVDIRLHGDFERSILRLRHFGLDSEEDFNWHSALWSSSIARLCRLFDRSAASTDQRRLRATRMRSELYCEN